MRLIFAGTPEFAREALIALVAAGHEVKLVLTRADKPAGRGQKLQASPVKQWAQARGLPLHQPATLRDPASQAPLRDADADVMVVAAYGLILPAAVLALPRHGCLNIHGSLLPRWRGAAPIQRAIEAGDAQTGITIMQMDEGLDTGAMLLAEPMPIAPEDTAASLHDKLAAQGARLIVRALDDLAAGRLRARAQPTEGVTYAHKILKAEAALDWSLPVQRLVDKIRAFDPFPGCVGWLRAEASQGEPEGLKIWRARAGRRETGESAAAPGTVLASGSDVLRVACGDGVIELLEVQRPGARRVPVSAWRAAGGGAPGSRFEPAVGTAGA